LLRQIEAIGRLSLTELARLTDLDRSTIGRNAKVLERMTLVETVSAKDQREAVLTLTDAGRRSLEESLPVWTDAQAAIEARVGGADGAADLRRLLKAL
jgi:DNA-binding MarR family transcriptional regulator